MLATLGWAKCLSSSSVWSWNNSLTRGFLVYGFASSSRDFSAHSLAVTWTRVDGREYRVCVMDASESVHLNVSCFCKIFRSLQKDNAGVLESTPSCRHFPSLGETLRCRNSWKISPTSHQTNRKTIKLRKFKVLGHGNRLPKLWHPRFHTGTSVIRYIKFERSWSGEQLKYA